MCVCVCCSYVKLGCPFKSKAKLFRGDIRCHMKELCLKRSVSCVHCNLSGDHQFIVGDHTDQCPCYPLLCPQGCKQSVIRKDLESHVDTCPLEPVSCPFSESGCRARILHKDLEKHIEANMLHHLTELAKSHACSEKII